MHTTRNCRGKSPSWRSATCEGLQNETLHFQTILSLRSRPVCLAFDICTDSHPASNAFWLPSSICRSVHFVGGHIYCLFFSFSLIGHRSLMEQLRRLQALIMNTSNKPAKTGTCVLVCVSLSAKIDRPQSGHNEVTFISGQLALGCGGKSTKRSKRAKLGITNVNVMKRLLCFLGFFVSVQSTLTQGLHHNTSL